jgi:hypothetical protein
MPQTAPTRREWCSRAARHRILLYEHRNAASNSRARALLATPAASPVQVAMNLAISSIGSVVGLLAPRTFGVMVLRNFLQSR